MRVKGLPGHRLASIMEQFGSAARLVNWSRSGHLLIADDRVPTLIPRITAKQRDVATREVSGWIERGLDVRTVLDPTYPRNLHDVFDRPPLIFIAGQWIEERDARSVANDPAANRLIARRSLIRIDKSRGDADESDVLKRFVHDMRNGGAGGDRFGDRSSLGGHQRAACPVRQ